MSGAARGNHIDLAGRVALITGAAQGIGLAIAHRFVASGAHVVLWDIQADKLPAARAELLAAHPQAQVDIDAVDIGNAPAVQAAAARIEQQRGRIDILINNAALIGPNATVVEYDVQAWHDVMHIGVNGTFHCCRAVVPGMVSRNYGRIVNIASVAGKEGNPNAGAYSAAKAAVIALTKTLGKELAAHNIAVNCVTPAVAATPGAMAQSPEHIRYMLSKIPRGRMLELHEAAAMVAWMVSEENSFTTAATFDLSGGRATY